MSKSIGASRERVWRALTVPEELIGWDERLISPVETLDDYPVVGRVFRWRYRLGTVPIVMRDSPREIQPLERLRTDLALGPLRFDETFTLGAEAKGKPGTRLALKLVTPNSAPAMGGLIDRFEVRDVATRFVDARLGWIRRWCEERP